MRQGRSLAVAAAAVAVAAAGCGLGLGSRSSGKADLTVTRDYGAEVLIEAAVEDPTEAETVLRFLDREAEVETRYGGGFVHSVEGLAGEIEDGRRLDWFFYVNGIESAVGAAEVRVEPGDRIWWDYREWTAAMRVPAVIGSWPQPLSGEVRLRCLGARSDCVTVRRRIEEQGGEVVRDPDGEAPTVLVGRWARVRQQPAAALVEKGPATSGVFGSFEASAIGYVLVALDERGEEERRLGRGTGLVAAVREGEEDPTWLVTGTDGAGVRAAAEALRGRDLRDRYALAVSPQGDFSLPVVR